MHLRLDPWAAEYNTAYYAQEIFEEHDAKVQTNIEHREWQAISPKAIDLDYQNFFFVDGSRRIEARVLLEAEQQQLAFGAIASYGIGAVCCCPRQQRQASYVFPERAFPEEQLQSITRVCSLGSGHALADFTIDNPITKQLGALNYHVESSPEVDPDAVIRKVQNMMLAAERRLSVLLMQAHPQSLIVHDGPLPKGRESGFENIVGYVKTIHSLKLGRSELEVVRSLAQGQRSPLYLVQEKEASLNHFEFFLRLRDPNPWLFSLAGMWRIQIHAGQRVKEKLEAAQNLADYLSIQLPKFASRQHQDPRAPQQLLPIKALEAELKRKMGHPQVIRRRITQYISTLK